MKRAFTLTVACLVVFLLTPPAAHAQNQWVRGPVTAMGADTITVTVKGVEHVFKIDSSTHVMAKGGSTAMKAHEQGKPAPKLGDFVKVGTHVEVHYKDAGGANMATEIRVVPGGSEAASSEHAAAASSSHSVQGTVVSVTAETLVVKEGDKDVTFAVTPKTTVLGKGASTKTRELKAAKKPVVITEFLKPNDRVVVSYEDGATPTAKTIQVTQPALK